MRDIIHLRMVIHGELTQAIIQLIIAKHLHKLLAIQAEDLLTLQFLQAMEFLEHQELELTQLLQLALEL